MGLKKPENLLKILKNLIFPSHKLWEKLNLINTLTSFCLWTRNNPLTKFIHSALETDVEL